MKKVILISVLALVLLFIGCGSSPAPKQQSLGDQLVLAAVNGSENEIRQLLAKGTDVNSRATFSVGKTHRITPLMNAVVGGNLQIVKLLVENGADLNLQDSNGITALIHAVLHKNTAIVKYLVESGANIDIQDNETLNALFYAVLDENPNFTIVKYLVDGGANVNVKDNFGNTAAVYAYKSRQMEIYNYLIKNGNATVSGALFYNPLV
jgi:ankyrin repeat protein